MEGEFKGQIDREEICEVLIVGAGIVGCAVAREVSKNGIKRVIIIEKNKAVSSGASGGNSGIFHTGFDAPTGSIEHQCMVNGHKLFSELMATNDFQQKVKFEMCGALVVAWNEEEEAKFPEILEKSKKNGVTAKHINQAQLRELEPNISLSAKSAIWVPTEAITDPNLFPIYFLSESLSRNSKILLSHSLKHAKYSPQVQSWQIICENNEISPPKFTKIKAKFVINCAGNYGDMVESILLASPPPFTITPRKGQFAVFDSSASQIVRGILLPVPTDRTKGVLVSRTVFGTVIVGPTAEDQDDRENAQVDDQIINQLIERAYEIYPSLRNSKVIGKYAGLRPASQHRDYQIRSVPYKNYICCGGIRSTGLTASLGIAQYTFKLLVDLISEFSCLQRDLFYLSKNELRLREKIVTMNPSSWVLSPPSLSDPYPTQNLSLIFPASDIVTGWQQNDQSQVYSFELAHWLSRISSQSSLHLKNKL